mgnify:CR=1 FL=1
MTGTTQISINTELYNHAADYARSHNTSVERMTEGFFMNLLIGKRGNEAEDHSTKRRLRQLSPELQWLGSLRLGEFNQQELEEDPKLAAIVEDRNARR